MFRMACTLRKDTLQKHRFSEQRRRGYMHGASSGNYSLFWLFSGAYDRESSVFEYRERKLYTSSIIQTFHSGECTYVILSDAWNQHSLRSYFEYQVSIGPIRLYPGVLPLTLNPKTPNPKPRWVQAGSG